MKNILLTLVLVSSSLHAGYSANVTFTTDYIWRGMTQSDGSAIQGGFDFESDSGFYAGIWGSNVNFNDGNGQELDYYAGYTTSLGIIGVDLGYIIYDYPDSNFHILKAVLALLMESMMILETILPQAMALHAVHLNVP
jgi:uncharacterized protein (TIGR02001 family)